MARRRIRVGKKQYAWVKWAVAAGIVLLLGVVLVASIGVGQWLLRTAEKYPASSQQEQVVVPEKEIIPVRVSSIKAHAYVLGNRYSGFVYAGVEQLCAPLRTADGALTFSSAVCDRAGWETDGSVDLAQNVENLHHNNLYLSAYMPIYGFAEQDAAQRELVLSYEAALIAEAAAAGVDEIFLTGLAPTNANISEVLQYLRRVKDLAGHCAIGVLIEPQVLLMAQYDVYIAAQLLQVCDFLVLDLRHLPLSTPITETQPDALGQTQEGAQVLTVTYIMESMQYDLQRYSPRLALSEDQTDALDYVMAKGYGNWVIMQGVQADAAE